MENEKINILYVDDEIHNLNSFKAAFRRDFNIYVAQSAREGRRVLDQNEIAVIVTDQRMKWPGKSISGVSAEHADAGGSTEGRPIRRIEWTGRPRLLAPALDLGLWYRGEAADRQSSNWRLALRLFPLLNARS